MDGSENHEEIAARIYLLLPVELASALLAARNEECLGAAIRSVLEPSEDDGIDEVGDPPMPEERPTTITIPPKLPQEPVREVTIEIDARTLRWLRARAHARGVSVGEFVMDELEKAARTIA